MRSGTAESNGRARMLSSLCPENSARHRGSANLRTWYAISAVVISQDHRRPSSISRHVEPAKRREIEHGCRCRRSPRRGVLRTRLAPNRDVDSQLNTISSDLLRPKPMVEGDRGAPCADPVHLVATEQLTERGGLRCACFRPGGGPTRHDVSPHAWLRDPGIGCDSAR